MLVLYQSNRLEHLADGLAALLRSAPPQPLHAQPILVASPGMGTWLQIRLAQSLGVAAGVEFPLPARWLWQQYRKLHQRVPDKSVWDKAPLTWVLWQKLDEVLAQPDCRALRDYLGDGKDAVKRYRLCVRLADLFDHYQMHRPDWLQAWAQQKTTIKIPDGQQWQPALWRLLQQWLPNDEARRSILMDAAHWQSLLRDAPTGVLPDKLVLFATGNLSAALLQVLNVFSEHLDVHLFLMNPSEQYWGDIRTREQVLREQLRNPDTATSLALDVGNPLLASLGEQGKSQLELLLGHWGAPGQEFDLFEAPGDSSLLARLQQDIFTLSDGATHPSAMPESDAYRNVGLHSCHSAMREVEVLHDRLLQMFADDPTLTPRDVIVMVPDVAPYAPLVEAVFGQRDQAVIPWAVADRTLADDVPLVRAFLALLKPSLMRFSANEVFDLLDVPALRRRFDIDVEDLPLLRQWVRDSGIRWGLDAGHRQSLGFPANHQNTWAHGLERLLLAVAAGDDALLWRNTLSLGGVQNSQVALVGKLAALVDTLRRHTQAMARARSATEWQGWLLALLDELFDGDDREQLDLDAVRDVIAEWVRDQSLAGMQDAVPVDVVHALLTSEFGRASGGQRFLNGAVNICTLMPMRTVPFRVVCLLGMNEKDYPHREHPPGYDLTAMYPRFGDRSRRAEDRYLFLEALLSARQYLHVSWCGRDIRSNETLPPSVVVADLIDYLDRAFLPTRRLPTDKKAEEVSAATALLTEHALQPFSRSNFDAGKPAQKSFSTLWYAVASNTHDDTPSAPLPPFEMPAHLSADELARFLVDPAATFLAQRYRVRLDERADQLDDDEPLVLSALESWQLRNESAGELLHGGAELPLAERWWLEGRVPVGPAGNQAMQAELSAAQDFAARVAGNWPDTVAMISLLAPVHGLEVNTVLRDHGDQGYYFWSPSKLFDKVTKKNPWQSYGINPKRILPAWINHLLLNMQSLPEPARTSHGYFNDVTITLRPLERAQAETQLAGLVALYRNGMDAPAPLLPATAWAVLAGLDVHSTFEKEVAGSMPAKRLYQATPDSLALQAYGETLWSLLRETAEVTIDD